MGAQAVATGPVSRQQAPQQYAQQAPAQREHCFYQHEQILVTNARFQVGNAMYPINGITAVAVASCYPNKNLGGGIGLIGMPFLFLGLLVLAGSGAPAGVILLAIAAVPIGVGIWIASKMEWTVQIATAGTQLHSVRHKNREYVANIVAALQQAIASRQ